MLNTFTKLKQRISNLETLINTKQDKLKSGTWTPLITTIEGKNPAVTYTRQLGSYRKIGDLVYIDFYIRGNITELKGTDNYALVGGIPYAFKSDKFGQQALSLGVCYNLLDGNPTPNLVGSSGGYSIRPQQNSGTSASKLKVSGSIGYFELGGSGVYKTN